MMGNDYRMARRSARDFGYLCVWEDFVERDRDLLETKGRCRGSEIAELVTWNLRSPPRFGVRNQRNGVAQNTGRCAVKGKAGRLSPSSLSDSIGKRLQFTSTGCSRHPSLFKTSLARFSGLSLGFVFLRTGNWGGHIVTT